MACNGRAHEELFSVTLGQCPALGSGWPQPRALSVVATGRHEPHRIEPVVLELRRGDGKKHAFPWRQRAVSGSDRCNIMILCFDFDCSFLVAVVLLLEFSRLLSMFPYVTKVFIEHPHGVTSMLSIWNMICKFASGVFSCRVFSTRALACGTHPNLRPPWKLRETLGP